MIKAYERLHELGFFGVEVWDDDRLTAACTALRGAPFL